MSHRTNPALWESVKQKWMKSDKGGNPGEWSARKAQLAVKEYKSRGGKYKGKKSSTNSLVLWGNEEWDYVGEKGNSIYLPKAVIKKLTPSQKRKLNKLKREATEQGEQHMEWPDFLTEMVNSVREKNIKKSKQQSKTGSGTNTKRNVKQTNASKPRQVVRQTNTSKPRQVVRQTNTSKPRQVVRQTNTSKPRHVVRQKQFR